MNTLDAIMTRRSVRKYTQVPLPEGIIDTLLRAAMAAPSAGNQQPWHFIVVTDPALLQKVPSIHPHAHMVAHAPAAILICADLQREKHKDMWPQDCSAATENLLLGAHDQGLGAVWLGIFPREDRSEAFSRLFGLPDHVKPFSMIALGCPAEKPAPADRYDPGRIHQNHW